MKYTKGAEDARQPKDFDTPRPVKIFLRDLKVPADQDDVVAEFDLDYSNFFDRKKIGRVTFWAITNNHLVETIALSDADQEPVKENKE